jgi:hypothetical protein
VTLGFDDVSLLPNLMDFDESSENDKWWGLNNGGKSTSSTSVFTVKTNYVALNMAKQIQYLCFSTMYSRICIQ